MSRESKPINPYNEIVFITRNGANRVANKEEINSIERVIPNQDRIHAIFFAGQEESRSEPFVKLLSKRLFMVRETPLNQFNTQTGLGFHSFGQLYHYGLFKSRMTYLNADQYQEKSAWYKMKNKGGAYDIVNIGFHHPVIIASCGVHLDSYSNEARLRETQILMSKIERDIVGDKTGYEKLALLATTSVLFGGDLNYRNIIEDGQSVDPTRSIKDPMRHFSLWGLSEARKDNSHTYLKKNTHKKNITDDVIVNEKDNTRLGETRGGKLDRVFYRGPITLTKESVIPNTNQTSDHKTVMAAFSVTPISNDIKKFEAAKQYVKTMIDGLKKCFSHDDQIFKDWIDSTDNLDYCEGKNNNYLSQLFEKLLILRNQALEAEKHRMKALDAKIKMKSWNPFKWLSGYFSFPKKHEEIAQSIRKASLIELKQFHELPKQIVLAAESSPVSENRELKPTESDSSISSPDSVGYNSPDKCRSIFVTPLLKQEFRTSRNSFYAMGDSQGGESQLPPLKISVNSVRAQHQLQEKVNTKCETPVKTSFTLFGLFDKHTSEKPAPRLKHDEERLCVM